MIPKKNKQNWDARFIRSVWKPPEVFSLSHWSSAGNPLQHMLNSYTQPLKSPHPLRGTMICMGPRGGNEVTEVTPKHTKYQWDADTDSNRYFDRIKSEYRGILLWTQHQNIHRMPRKGCDFSQILLDTCQKPKHLDSSRWASLFHHYHVANKSW